MSCRAGAPACRMRCEQQLKGKAETMHDHADGHAHSHHHHGSDAPAAGSVDRNTALLAYMVDHNKSHAGELHDLAHELDGEAADLIHAAVALFDQGNEKLDQALSILKGE